MAEQLKIKLDKTSEPAVDLFTTPEASDLSQAVVDKTKQGLEDIFNLY